MSVDVRACQILSDSHQITVRSMSGTPPDNFLRSPDIHLILPSCTICTDMEVVSVWFQLLKSHLKLNTMVFMVTGWETGGKRWKV